MGNFLGMHLDRLSSGHSGPMANRPVYAGKTAAAVCRILEAVEL